MDYFVLGKMKSRVGDYLIRLKHENSNEDFQREKIDHLIPVIESFYNVPEVWDLTTQYNIENLSESFYNDLSSRPSDQDELDLMISTVFRFCIERQMKTANEMPREIRRFKNFCIDKKALFTTFCQEQMNYALQDMPVGIISSILTSPAMKHFREIPKLLVDAEKFTNEWATDLELKTQKVDELQTKLETQKNAFNFVGLYDGFNKLSEIKRVELNWAKVLLFSLGLAIVVPLLFEVYSLTREGNDGISNVSQLIKFIPIASLTLILIYYFRVALSNFQSIRSQVVQIELRKTLCAFIQSYVEYAKDIKNSDSEILKKFEDVVFTNIMTAEEKVPSTFDGLEQIASMVTALKGGK